MRRSMQMKEQGILKIEIIDSGIGIEAENMEKLFKPFSISRYIYYNILYILYIS